MDAHLQEWCEEARVPYESYAPSAIKKHATGKGNAGKPAMLAAACQKWPKQLIKDDNQADALWLLDLALWNLGLVAQKTSA